MALDDDKLLVDIRTWVKGQSRVLRSRVVSQSLSTRAAIRKATWHKQKTPDYKPLAPSIGGQVRTRGGLVERINFVFAVQGRFLEHGVGKGRPITSGRKRPKPWIAPVLDPAIDQLAAIIQEGYADAFTENIRFLIPGIIDKKIKL